jgi:protein-S-isoprenylcysteine O-methyltransferase Ste14
MDSFYVPTPQVLELNVEIKRLNRLRLKGSLVGALGFALVVLFTDRDAASTRLVELCGGLLIVAALGLRLWALGSIDGHKKRVLVTWGPYRYVRHPLYGGSLLFALGTCLVAGSLTAALLLCLVLFRFYLPVLYAEERFLAARFGAEWDVYRSRTGMLWPRAGQRLPGGERPFHLRRPLREIGTLLLLPLIAYGTAVLAHYLDRRYGLPDWFF